MILDAYGRTARKQTETRWDPRLMDMLMALDQLLRDNGLGLHCMRCHRLGNHDGVEANNDPASSTFRLTCGCAVRTFHKRDGREKVTDLMAVS